MTGKLGTSDGESAKNMSKAIIPIGTSNSIRGGGGSGGRTNGSTNSDTVKIAITTMDLTLKYPTIKIRDQTPVVVESIHAASSSSILDYSIDEIDLAGLGMQGERKTAREESEGSWIPNLYMIREERRLEDLKETCRVIIMKLQREGDHDI